MPAHPLALALAKAGLYFGPGWLEDVTYPPNTKLRECQVLIKRGGTLMFFTVWSWLLLATYFALAALLGFAADFAAVHGAWATAFGGRGGTPEVEALAWAAAAAESPWARRLTLLTWEVAAPNALLVTVVVTFVIWPEMKEKGCTEGLKAPIVLMQHNLNTVGAAPRAICSLTTLGDRQHATRSPLLFSSSYCATHARTSSLRACSSQVLVMSNLFATATPLLAAHAAAAPIFGLVCVRPPANCRLFNAPRAAAAPLYARFVLTSCSLHKLETKEHQQLVPCLSTLALHVGGACSYVAFSWLAAPWIAPEHGAVYLYFFFDPTQGTK